MSSGLMPVHWIQWTNQMSTGHFNMSIGHLAVVLDINHIVQYSTVQYSTVQYSTVQYSTVQYSTVQGVPQKSDTIEIISLFLSRS
jgi:hypothetical protein